MKRFESLYNTVKYMATCNETKRNCCETGETGETGVKLVVIDEIQLVFQIITSVNQNLLTNSMSIDNANE